MTTQVWMMTMRKKTTSRSEETKKLSPSLMLRVKGSLPELTYCMENCVACSLTDTSDEHEDRVLQLVTQVVGNECCKDIQPFVTAV